MHFSKEDVKGLRAFRTLIGNNIHQLRLQRRITLKKLASITGISVYRLDSYEIGKNIINIDAVYAIAIALQVPPGRLIRQEYPMGSSL